MPEPAAPTVAIRLTLQVPDTLAREAKASGLLTPRALEALLRAELRRRRVNRLFAAADRLAALELPPHLPGEAWLTAAEVEAEIQAARVARRSTHAGGS